MTVDNDRIEHDGATFPWDLKRRAPDPRIASALIRPYEGYVDRRTHAFDRHLPIAHVPVIIGFGAPMRIRGDGAPDGSGDAHTTFVAGLYESPTVGETVGQGMGVQVDFAPIAAHQFFGVPMHQLANRVVELDDVFGTEARTLVEQLQLAPTWTRRFELIDAFILPRMAVSRAASPGLVWAWRRLNETHGNVSIGALAAELGCSRKHLIEKFREQVGLPPKAVARVMRFNRSLALMRRAQDSRWVDIAYRAGYYDQAHMIRDFREFAGATPTEFARATAVEAGTALAAL
jgi:AraC-like DNA-binding protein